MRLLVRRVDPRARLPMRAHSGDAGLDLHALEDAVIAPRARMALRTGIAVEIPSGQAGLLLPRSGLAARHGVTLLNSPGLIDSGYRGELQVLLLNTDVARPHGIASGDRIAQLVLVRVESPTLVEVGALACTPRGGGSFGSTGT